ncbi:MAG: large conductance mechanosensitive channel protein MscL [Planctomycetes bacterium]|nr:large conductance mechanosensitive channel protein MscL [Planctomycetota bacterium]
MLRDFREFAMRGNVVDLAVGIIIGAAFGKIITSLVNDVLMPPIGKAMGNVDFSNLFISLDPSKTEGISSLVKAKETGAALIAYGSFVNTVIDFIIVAFCIFMVVKVMSKLRHAPESGPPTTKECPLCLSTIPLKATRCGHCTSQI